MSAAAACLVCLLLAYVVTFHFMPVKGGALLRVYWLGFVAAPVVALALSAAGVLIVVTS